MPPNSISIRVNGRHLPGLLRIQLSRATSEISEKEMILKLSYGKGRWWGKSAQVAVGPG